MNFKVRYYYSSLGLGVKDSGGIPSLANIYNI